MAIQQINTSFAGEVGVEPRIVRLLCDDSYSEITTLNYLKPLEAQGYSFLPTDVFAVRFSTLGSSFGWFTPTIDSTGITLAPAGSDVQLPVLANHFAIFASTDGTLTDDVAIAINGGDIQAGLNAVAGKLRSYSATTTRGYLELYATANSGAFTTGITNAAMGQNTVLTIPNPSASTANFLISAGNQTITTGNLILSNGTISASGAIASVAGDISATAGNFNAGSSGNAGGFTSYPATAAMGSLRLAAANNAGNTQTIITNASFAQGSTLTIPDPGAASANFLLDAGTGNLLTDYQEFVPLTDILINSVGTWTRTRVAQGNYSLVHTPADDTSVIGIDITPAIRTAASKGFRLTSIDVIYSIGTLALDAHTWTLDVTSYANDVAVSVTPAGVGSLSTATQANPYVSSIEPITPAFLNTACSKYNLELTVDAAATSEYSFYGLNLHFSQTIA